MTAKRSTKSRVTNRAEAKPQTVKQTVSGGRTIAQRTAALNRFREQYNPLRGLTLSRAVRLLEDYQRGDMAAVQWTYFFIEQTDADLLALIELGLSRLGEMDWDVVASEDADEAIAKAQIEFLRERFDAIDNLHDAIEHLASARFRGFAHCEICTTGGVVTHLELVDQWNTVRDGFAGGWRYNPDAKSASFDSFDAESDMPLERFLFREVRRPVNRIALLKFIRANLSEKDWDAFIEIYGIPSGVVIGPADVPEEKETEYGDSAKTIAEGGSGYLPYGSQYVQNRAPAGENPFKTRLDHLSEKLVLAGTGGKLTMLTDATGLGSGASEAHSKVFDSIASAEARRISEVFNRQLVAVWLAERFPGQPAVAYFRISADEETDTSKMIEDVKTLSDAGFELDEGEVTERTGWKVTKKTAPAPVVPSIGVDLPAQPAIKNRSAADLGRDATFAAIARADLTAAGLVDQAPILRRLAELDEATDDASWLKLARKLDADWPDLLAAWVKAGGKADAFRDIFGTALVSGAVEGAKARTPQIENKAPVLTQSAPRPAVPKKTRRRRS